MFFSALEKASRANSAGFAVDLMPLGITDFSILMTKSKTTKKKRRRLRKELYDAQWSSLAINGFFGTTNDDDDDLVIFSFL